ncbi:hypothetical protein [Paenibacillus chitinolyticus]|uniref:hypothetical protein n=1 Tax=Paenibacillus chitinolyticus TaxID=79263 RepID=UPI00366B2333
MIKYSVRSKYNDDLISEFVADLPKGVIKAVYDVWDNSDEDIKFIDMLKKFHPASQIIELTFLDEEWLRL